MDAFNDYEDQLKELCQSVRKQCELVKNAKGDAKRKAISDAKEAFEEAEEVFQSLTLASHALGTQAAKVKVKTFEQEIGDLRKVIERSKMLYGTSTDRDDLLGGLPADLATTSVDQRKRVAADTEKLKRTTDVVRQASVTAEESVKMGIDSLAELHKHREKIEASREKLGAVNQSLSTGQRIMRGMGRRVMTNKLITLLLALILIGGICLIVWLKWFDNPDPVMMTGTDNSTTTILATTAAPAAANATSTSSTTTTSAIVDPTPAPA